MCLPCAQTITLKTLHLCIQIIPMIITMMPFILHFTQPKIPTPSLYGVYCIVFSVYCILGVAQIFRFTCTFFGASLHTVEHVYKVSAKNNDRYPNLNAVLCLPLNNSTSILCSNTWLSPTRFVKLNDCFKLYFSKSKKLLRYDVFLLLL